MNFSINAAEQPLDVAFHPSENIIACCMIDGKVSAWRYGDEKEPEHIGDVQMHRKSCRSIAFSPDGQRLYSASKDRSIRALDVATQRVLFKHRQSHAEAINRIVTVNENCVATGDEAGVVSLWDTRTPTAVAQMRTWHDNEDYISALQFVPASRTLLAAGYHHSPSITYSRGDGFLSVFDVRKPNLVARSDNLESELLSLAVIKGGKKVVVGDADGVMGVFSWGDWGDVRDRFPGHPASVDALCRFTDDLVFTGSSDGYIRLVQVQPNELVGVVGDQGEFAVERLVLDRHESMLASCSHDNVIRLWDVRNLLSDQIDEHDINDDEHDFDVEERASDDGASKHSTAVQSDSDSDDSGEEKRLAKKQRKGKHNLKSMPKRANSFFDGLASDSDNNE